MTLHGEGFPETHVSWSAYTHYLTPHVNYSERTMME